MNFFVSLLIISPVFISIGSGFNIAFDRSGGGPSSFIMSIPLSLIVVIAMVFLLYKNIIIDIIRRGFKIETVYLILSVALYFFLFFIYSKGVGSLTAIKTIFQVLFFFISLYVFSLYFEKQFDRYKNKKHVENVIVFYPIVIIVLISLLSSLIYKHDNFLTSQLVNYSFRQYYGFIFLVIMGISHSRGVLCFILAMFASIYISILSSNDTTLAASLILILIVIIDFLIKKQYRKILLNFETFFYIILALSSFFIIDFYLENISHHPGLMARHGVIISFFESFNAPSIVLPFLSHNNGLSVGYHNQFIVIYNTIGLIGFLLYYFIFLKKLNYLPYKVRMIKSSIIIVTIIGGITSIPTMHFYTSIFVAYILSFYIILYSTQNERSRQALYKTPTN